MQKRKLGRSTLEVSAIGFGRMGLNFSHGHARSKEESITLIRQAMDCGVTFFDTAEVVGSVRNKTPKSITAFAAPGSRGSR